MSNHIPQRISFGQSKYRKRRLAIACLCGLIGASLAVLYEPEPVYGDWPLSSWVDQIESALSASPSCDPVEDFVEDARLNAAECAIRSMGPSAIPFLRDMLSEKDPPWKPAMIRLTGVFPILSIRQGPASLRRHAALIAIIATGIDLKILAAELATLRDDPALRQEAELALQCLNAASSREPRTTR